MNTIFVGLKLLIQDWDKICKNITDTYIDDVNIAKVSNEFKGKLYDSESHVTLYYNEDCKVGPNMMYFTLSIDNRELYSRLSSNKLIYLPEIKLKIFNNPEFKVLVIDLSTLEGEIRDIIYSYNLEISKKYGFNQSYPVYQPHVTITYLNSDFDDDKLPIIEQYINDHSDHQFQITDFMLGGMRDDEHNSIRLPII